MTLTTPIPPTRCPHCGVLLGAATSVGGDARPAPGDATVCSCCTRVLVLDDQLRPLRAPAGFVAHAPSEVRSVIERAQQASLERHRGRHPSEES